MPEQQPEGGGDPDLASFPPKGSRPPPPPPGGGPGASPGGFGGFGDFRRSAVFHGLRGLNDASLPVLLRKRGLQQQPVGPPGRTDTVPAMLTPGEKVIPANVAQDPMYGRMADQMIQQGRNGMAPGEMYGQAPMGFSEGGEVPDMPGQRPSRAIRLLQLLLELDEMDGAQHFAFGGTVQPSPWGRLGGGGGGFGQTPRPQATPQSPPGDGYNRDVEGNVTNFNQQNPWGNYQGNQNAYGLGLLYRGVGNAGAQGAFDPRGNQALMRSQIEAAQGTKDALVRRQMTAADLYGLDPAQQAVAKLQAQRDAGRGVQDISAQIRAAGADRAQSFNEQMYQDLYRGGQQYNNNEQNARNERIAQQNANSQGGGLGGFFGNVLGVGLGQFAGGYGGALGKRKGEGG